MHAYSLTFGIVFLVVGLLWTLFKGYVVWTISRDVFNGGGAPTLDFPIICPIPIAVGTCIILSALGKHPFPGFGLVLYLCLALFLGFLLGFFDRLGAPERARQLENLKKNNGPNRSGA